MLVATSGGIDLSRFDVEDWRPAYRAEYPHAQPFATHHQQVDLSDQLATIQARTLLMWSRGDPISPELLPSVFDPFRRGAAQAEKRSGVDGLGLGLYIVKEVVLAHGGSIEVTSTVEDGTTFTVRLPVHAPVAAPDRPTDLRYRCLDG